MLAVAQRRAVRRARTIVKDSTPPMARPHQLKLERDRIMGDQSHR